MADVKSLLKDARRLIDEKKFNEAQELCRSILHKDKKNYIALVLLGKSLQDNEKAPLAFIRAVSFKPNHPLAWQGLINYYERQESIEEKAKLFNAYDNFLKLEVDEEKVLEILNKVGQLGCTLKNSESVSIILRYLVDKEHEKYHDVAEKLLLELLRADVVCKEEDIPIIADHLKQMLIKDDYDFPSKQLLVKVILQKKDLVSAFTELTELIYFQSNAVREYICRCLYLIFLEHETFFKLDVEKYIHDLTRECKEQKYSVLLQSMVLFEKGRYVTAFKECIRLINYRKPDTIVVAFLFKCAYKLKKWQAAEKIARNFMNLTKDKDFNLSLKKHWFRSLVEQEKWKEARSISKYIPSASLDENERAILARCYIENDEDAGDIMKSLQGTKHDIQLQALILFKDKKYHEAITLLEQDPDYPLNLYFIGRSYWELEEYKTSFTYLIKAAQLNRDHAYTFLYLGMYFHKINSEYTTAKKCYERAYALNNIDGNILLNLSDVYVELELNDTHLTMLCRAYQALYLRYPWISFRLGILYGNRREWGKAVIQFQNVIKTELRSAVAYECLADAYYGRGSYKSAQGTYAKAIAADPNRTVHCLTKIGYVQTLLTYHEKAILSFQKVLELDPKAINALKGMARSWLKIAKKKLSDHLFGRARDCAQNAINCVMKAIAVKKNFMCLWSYLGKALMFITKLPDQYIFADITFPKPGETEEVVRKEKSDVFLFAFACFSRVINQRGHVSSYNLALAYFKYYYATRDLTNCRIAFQLTVDCIRMKPRSWKNWNLLGCICILLKRYDLGQHCLIKGLEYTTKTTIPRIWCNLGFLYIKIRKYILANHCFTVGQFTLLTFQRSWIGQALCAEAIREREALDLFRHANSLGNHPESAVAFSDWICRVLKDYDSVPTPGALYFVDEIYGVTLSIDLLVWVTAKAPSNVCASNYLGYFQERKGLLRSALKSYKTAARYADDNKKNLILINIGRVYFKMGKYDKSVQMYKAVTEASLNSACGLALALYKKKNYKEAYAAYETALHWLCNKDDEKAEVLVAMAGIVYRLKGLDSAKTLLFRGVQISQSNPNPYCLFGICALGYLHSDHSLSTLALRELERYENHNEYMAHITFLKYMYKFKREDIGVLNKCLQSNPRDIELVFIMARSCINTSIALLKKSDTFKERRATVRSFQLKSKDMAIKAGCYARRALYLSYEYENMKFCVKMFATAVKARRIERKKSAALLLAKKCVHQNPWDPGAWITFMSLIRQRKYLTRKKITWLTEKIRRLKKKRVTTKKQIKWFSSFEKKLRRIRGRRW